MHAKNKCIFIDNSITQDHISDIDYLVFTDAAKFVLEGQSPYRRDTYRYTPLLAFTLVPNLILSPLFGKWLFAVFDIVCGCLIYKLLQLRCNHRTAVSMSLLWLYNPLPMAVSTRGSAESLVVVFVLAIFYFVEKDRFLAAGICYGAAVHVKIYPVTYCLALYLYIGRKAVEFVSLRKFIASILPETNRCLFVLSSVGTFLFLTTTFYLWYGNVFLNEAYLYHVNRKDTRHNFSIYFYLLYLTGDEILSSTLGLLAFLPQITLVIVTSFCFYDQLPFSCFLLTFIFVMFNKVVTSQYFLWYLCLLPLVVPYLSMSASRLVILTSAWFVSQSLWLFCAYMLEFHGLCTFLLIWLTSILFFLINTIICGAIIDSYKREESGGKDYSQQTRAFIN